MDHCLNSFYIAFPQCQGPITKSYFERMIDGVGGDADASDVRPVVEKQGEGQNA
ncbi:hypothetical protein [Salmonirosea aquatica]|uniref:hypothetical protein n=1 Tax=Salmonirosea aquatica TaxID=2654236 RepID=UPI003570F8AF